MRQVALLVSIAAVAVLATATAAFAQPAAHASVIGGMPAGPGDWPSAAFVASFKGDVADLCTGTVVAPRVVLTAAHCIPNPDPSDYRVITGSVDWANEVARQVNEVTQVAAFPNWNPQTTFGDAAVIILAGPANVPAMPFATLNDVALLRASRRVSFAGWGQTFTDDPNPPTTLKTGTQVLQSPSYCGRNSADLFTAFQSAGMLCAIDSRDFAAGGCHGDSGGPLVAKRADGTTVEIAITTAVGPRCTTRLATFFTRVDLVAGWVQAWIDALAAAPGAIRVVPPYSIPPTSSSPPLGRMSAGEVSGNVRREILAKMGSRFRGAKGYHKTCRRQSAASVKCNVRWSRSGNAYKGVVTVFLRFDRTLRLVVVDSKSKFTKRRARR